LLPNHFFLFFFWGIGLCPRTTHVSMCSLTGLQLAAILATYLVALAACRKTGSVYCFALVTPSTSEPALLAVQYLLKVGVFQCDGWGIISNVSAEVLLQAHWKAVDGVRANYGIVDTELFVKQVSGPPGFDPSSPHQFLHTGAKHLANTPVFQKVWDKVFELGKWQDYEWTIKLDVDAVPLPLRLHDYLKNRPQKQVSFDPFPGAEIPFMAEYLHNARHDMYGNFLHGPAEVVSWGAMQIFRRGHGRCKKAFPPMKFGEDFYLNKCLELLGIPSVKAAEVPLLYDTYEWGKKSRKTCYPQTIKGEFQSQNFAVYHAHKTITEWLDCYAQAKSGPAISDDMKQWAIKEVTRRPTMITTTTQTTSITTTTRTTSTVTPLNHTDLAPAVAVYTTVVMVMADAQSTPQVVTCGSECGWIVRMASQAIFVAMPFLVIAWPRNMRWHSDRTAESGTSLVDNNANFMDG